MFAAIKETIDLHGYNKILITLLLAINYHHVATLYDHKKFCINRSGGYVQTHQVCPRDNFHRAAESLRGFAVVLWGWMHFSSSFFMLKA